MWCKVLLLSWFESGGREVVWLGADGADASHGYGMSGSEGSRWLGRFGRAGCWYIWLAEVTNAELMSSWFDGKI